MSPPKRTFRNANTPTPLKLPKGKLEKIDFGEYSEEVKRIWSGKPQTSLIQSWERRGIDRFIAEIHYNHGSEKSRMNRIRKLVGYRSNLVGYCSKCRNLNTHILKQKISGAVIVTRFCEEHVPDKM